jgi:rod shape-determining protein MreD
VQKDNVSDALRWTVYAAEILIFFVLQENNEFFPEIFGARPVLLLPVFASIAVFERLYPSMIFGLTAGMLLDAGLGTFIGAQSFLMLIWGFVLGLMFTYFIKVGFFTYLPASFLIIALSICFRFWIFFILPGFEDPQYVFIAHILPSIIYTFVAAPLTYLLNRYIFHRIRLRNSYG